VRISRLAALVANASEKDRVEFFRQCSLPTHKELEKVTKLLAKADPKRVALYKNLGQEESLSPTDQAAILFSKYHPEFSWYELEHLDEELYNSLPESKRDNIIDYWGDIEPDDPTLLQVIDELGLDGVLCAGEYEVVEIPRGIEIFYREEIWQRDAWEWYRYLSVQTAHVSWEPQVG
jgi:hypothetical protein